MDKGRLIRDHMPGVLLASGEKVRVTVAAEHGDIDDMGNSAERPRLDAICELIEHEIALLVSTLKGAAPLDTAAQFAEVMDALSVAADYCGVEETQVVMAQRKTYEKFGGYTKYFLYHTEEK